MNLPGGHEVDTTKNGSCPDTVVFIHEQLVDDVVIKRETIRSLVVNHKLLVAQKDIYPIPRGDDNISRLIFGNVGYIIGGDAARIVGIMLVKVYRCTLGIDAVQSILCSNPEVITERKECVDCQS